MLKLDDYRSKAKGLPDLLPYAALIAPDTVLCKDASLLASWTISGRDTASSTADELAWVSAQVSRAVQMLSTGWMLHVDAIRSPRRAYPENSGNFPDPVTALIDEERAAFFSGDVCHATATVLTVTCRPDFAITQLADKVRNGQKQDCEVLDKAVDVFRRHLDAIEDALSAVLSMHRLAEQEAVGVTGEKYTCSQLLAHLQHCVAATPHPIRVPAAPMYLDALIGGVDLIGGMEPQLGGQHLVVIAIDGFPQESWPSMLSVLDKLPTAYRYSTRYICLDQLDAAKEVDKYRKGWSQKVFRFIDQMLNSASARMNRDAAKMHEDAEDALTLVQGGGLGFGYLTSNIVLINPDKGRVYDIARDFIRVLQTSGFGCRVETVNALEAWLGTHPGNWYANVRRPLVSTMNLADLLPVASVWTGSPTAPCPFYPPESPPLAVLTTDGNTPFFFNLHHADIGHTCIFGPTGSGKSTLLALIAAQFRRYPGATLYAFDKGNSLLPLCLAVGGNHYDVGRGGLAFAPLQRINESDAEFAWAANWLSVLAELQKVTVLPVHKKAIHQALESLRSNPPNMRSLSNFIMVVQNQDLKDALSHYSVKGALRELLDAEEDGLGVNLFQVFEIDSLMEMGDANLLPVLLYLFRRIEKSLQGQPSLLILDEAWVMLGHPVFREKIREWLKVFRKLNCAVVLATQQLADAKRSGIFDVVVESCPLKVLLPNHSARQADHAAIYSDMGLNARQIDIIAQAVPKRDYYLVSPAGRRLVQLALGRKTLAFVGASDKESLARITELSARHGQDWPMVWLEEKGI